METLQTQTRPGLSGTALKLAACITMLIDHLGASCIEATYGVAYRTPPQILQLDRVLRLIGRLAFPIFCFLLVEGFLHTHDVKKYIGRLFLFGLLSEVPFDMAFFKTPFHWGNQNVYWTLALVCWPWRCCKNPRMPTAMRSGQAVSQRWPAQWWPSWRGQTTGPLASRSSWRCT